MFVEVKVSRSQARKEQREQEDNRQKRLAREAARERRVRVKRERADQNWAGKGFNKRNEESTS